MTIEDARALLTDATAAAPRRVATRFAFELTVLARGTCGKAGEVGRQFNEQIHRVLDTALEAEEGHVTAARDLVLAQAEPTGNAERDSEVHRALHRAMSSLMHTAPTR